MGLVSRQFQADVACNRAPESGERHASHSIAGVQIPLALRSRSITNRLMLLVIILAVPLNGVIFAVVWFLAEAAADSQRLSLLYTARSIAAGVDAELGKYITLARTLASSPSLVEEKLDTFEAEARRAFAPIKNTWVLVSDVSGQQLVNLAVPHGQPLPRRSGPAFADQQRALASRSIIVSDMLVGRVTRKWIANIEVPIFKDDEPFRDLAITMDMEGFHRLLDAQDRPKNWFVGIMDRQGRLVARVPNPGTLVGQLAAESWREVKDKDGLFEAVNLEDDPVTVANAHSVTSGWTIGVAVKTAELQAATWSAVRLAAMLGGGVSAFSILFAAFVARQIAKPIHELRDKAAGLLQGTPSRFQPEIPEIKELWDALKQASTERSRSEAERRQFAERFRTIYVHALAGIAILDWDGRFQQCNPAFCALLGYSEDELRGRTFSTVIHPDDRAADMEKSRRLRAGEAAAFVIESRYVHKGGQPIWVQKIISTLPDETGKAAQVFVLAIDITERRKAEADLRSLNASLEKRVREEIEVREAAQAHLAQAEKWSALGQLAGGVAHDFNNVLQAVTSGASSVGRHASDPAKVRRIAQMLEDVARRGASITHRLLSFARRSELRAERIEIATLLEGVREVLAHTLGASINIRLDVATDLPPVLADRSQLETALVNLATNARDAMPGGGNLTFSAFVHVASGDGHVQGLAPGRYIQVTVADTGVGMDDRTLARAMEPFFTTKGPGKGTGLGLSMARGFAEQTGGVLTVSSALGCGTTVTLWLPVMTAKDLRLVLSDAVTDRSRAATGRVLLVDDDAAVRDGLADELAGCGYHVLQAASGVDALALMAKEPVDLIVSDLSMPGMDGVSLLREVRLRQPLLPAILLTGFASEAATLMVDTTIEGSVSLVRKPISGAQLADHVALLIEV